MQAMADRARARAHDAATLEARRAQRRRDLLTGRALLAQLRGSHPLRSTGTLLVSVALCAPLAWLLWQFVTLVMLGGAQ
jgi:hypothetical protein